MTPRPPSRSVLLPLIACIGGFSAGTAYAQVDSVQSLDIRVPVAPQPVRIGDDLRLFYELHLINFSASAVTLKELVALDADTQTEIARLEGDGLTAALGRTADKKDAPPRSLETGTHNVLYMNVTLHRAAPARLVHRITLTASSAGKPRETTLQTDVTPIDTHPLPELGPPLKGGPWAALYDPSMERGHRRVLYAVDGHAHLPGRFAIDFFGIDTEGRTHRNDGARTADYFGYGADVLAVADGTVIAARDDFTEPTLIADAHHHSGIGDATGVYIALDIGRERIVFYEHLKPGLAVKPGQRVKRGARLGALGLTGQATTPHLHFHVADAAAPVAAEGMPYQFAVYTMIGGYSSIVEFGNKPWQPLPTSRAMNDSMPAANVIVNF